MPKQVGNASLPYAPHSDTQGTHAYFSFEMQGTQDLVPSVCDVNCIIS